MRIRGKRLAWLVVPIVAVVVAVLALQPRSGPATAGERDAPHASIPGLAGAMGAAPSAGDAAAVPGPSGAGSSPGAASMLAPTTAPATTAGPTQVAVPATVPPARPTAARTLPPPPAAPTSPPVTPAPPTPAPPAAGPIPPLSACAIFPASNVWNRRVDELPVAPDSATMIAAIGLDASLHPDFSNAGGYGIPFNVVGTSTPRSTVSFQYDDESDHLGYPIPASPKIEGGGDRHLLMIDTDDCALYELFAAASGGSGWTAGSGAAWDLGSNALRPDGWTSADAAGLPIFPGLVRYAEVAAGGIHHAIRFTAPQTCEGYLYPARHEAGSGSCNTRPPMGLRVRLKASVDISGFGPQSQVILTALKEYGMLLADNGSPWYITGAPDSGWNDDELHQLGDLTGIDFEVVDTTGFVNG